MGNRVLIALYSLFPILHFVAAANASENFTNADPAITVAAETARLKSAKFWTETALPGNWYTPCPVYVRDAQHSGGGATSFRFEDGEVFDWSMTIEGPRALLLRDVIPHEVDHMVRASLVRHPIERWLDEGCATLFESKEVHQNLRAKAATVDASIIQKKWLGSLDYPDNSADVLSLYAVGFSLVEFLLIEQNAETLLGFQRDQTSIEQRLTQHYKLTIPELREKWDHWRKSERSRESRDGSLEKREARNGALHDSIPHSPFPIFHPLRCECTNRNKPLLVIWTAKWCGPCRLLWQAWNTNAAFKKALRSRFHIHILDYDQHRALALKHGIQHLPTFQSQQVTVVGFQGTDSLLKQLLTIPPTVKPGNESNIAIAEEPRQESLESEKESAGEREMENREMPTLDSPFPIPHSPYPSLPLTPSTQATTPPKKTTSIIKDLISVTASIGIPTLWGGVAAGSGGTAILGWAALQLLRRRARRRKSGRGGEGEKAIPFPPSSSLPISPSLDPSPSTLNPPVPFPFPRKLDEARQLLELRKSEGRVGLLDALRGMFLDDEIEKLKATNPEANSVINQLVDAIDRRVDAVAPLSTKYE